jgi:hypothetical protein
MTRLAAASATCGEKRSCVATKDFNVEITPVEFVAVEFAGIDVMFAAAEAAI